MDYEKWLKEWEKAGLYNAEPVKGKKKFFMIFAYPGISGYLHVGHMRGFSYTDFITRYKRMQGYNILFPVGTHASGNQAISFAAKVRSKDSNWINYLKSNGCPDKIIASLTEPEKIVDYFNKIYINDYWKKFGFLADWRRFTCTTYNDYNKFIQWQFKKLNDNKLLVQKPYYATFCPEHGPVAVDASETDISKGGNAEKIEYTLLKFKFDKYYLVAATLRPETVFGQTNLWINPDTDYVKTKVGKETWIVSKEAATKLSCQFDDVKLGETIKGKDLIGKYALAPGANKEIIILPSTFAKSEMGTGIVTSVPSDAPYDWIALKDLQNNKELCRKYKLDFDKVKAIVPIPIIESKGFGEFPAKEACEKFGIKNQDDTEKLEEATKEVYKAGFHTGIMRPIAGKFKNIPVEKAKELVKQDLIAEGKAAVLHDLSEEVLCRCSRQVIIKKIEDQWFIRYSDSELTKKSKDHVKKMEIMPSEYKQNLPAVLDWFQDRACTRLGNWLGTKLPFDEKWIIEPISDSTLYPAYYIISKYVNDGTVKTEQLNERFFDYVFLGKGNIKEVSKSTKLSEDTLKRIHNDFEYWYPLDINLGGKEHQTVHFPVFLMNHVAVLHERHWPKGIFVNWWVIGKGSKISKSKGGAEPVTDAITKYTIDGMRLYYAHIGSPHTDVVWDDELALNYKSITSKALSQCKELLSLKGSNKSRIDKWFESKYKDLIRKVTDYMETYNFREVVNLVYFDMQESVKWYLRRKGNNKDVAKEFVQSWAKMMSLITPFTAEEIWHISEAKGLVSTASWPKVAEEEINLKSMASENMVLKCLEDVREVLRLAKIEKPKKVTLFVAESWKHEAMEILKKELAVTRDIGQIMKSLMKDPKMAEHGKEASSLAMAVAKDPSKIPIILIGRDEEFATFSDASSLIEEEFNAKIEIISAEVSKENKARQALPGKPAILLS